MSTTTPASLPREREPYVGLLAFEAKDADRFYGRRREIWELDTLVFASQVVVLHGPAGVGKTSLLQAGLLPQITSRRAAVLPLVQLPRASTLPATATPGVNPFVGEALATWATALPAEVAGAATTLVDLVEGLPVATNRYGDPLPLVIVVDQVDELFRAGPEWAVHREAFLDQLAAVANRVDRARLVLSTRQDTVGELLSFEPRLVGGSRRRYRLDPLGRDAAIEAIVAPLKATSRELTPEAAEHLVDRLMVSTITDEAGVTRTTQAATVEPISLQVVCLSLWRSLPDEVTTITPDVVVDYFRDQGDVEATLTGLCVEAVTDAAARHELPDTAVWSWLEQNFVTDLGTRGTVHQGHTSTADMPHGLAHALEDRRILRSEKRAGSVWFELLHDVLVEPIRRGRLVAEGLAADDGRGAGPEGYLRMAKRALRAGQLALAEEYAWAAVRADEADPAVLAEAHTFLGELVLDQGRGATGERADELYLSAEDRFRRAAELFDAAQNAWAVGQLQASLGRMFMERGRYVDAVSELRSALDRSRDVAIRLDFARALAQFGDTQAALGEYTSALVSMPDEAETQRVEALVGRGILAIARGDNDTGLHDLGDAIRIRPELADRADVAEAWLRALASRDPAA